MSILLGESKFFPRKTRNKKYEKKKRFDYLKSDNRGLTDWFGVFDKAVGYDWDFLKNDFFYFNFF